MSISSMGSYNVHCFSVKKIKAPSGKVDLKYLSGTISATFGILIMGLGWIFISKVKYFGCY